MLQLSSSTLQKIKKIIGGRPAYIIGGYPGFQDITLSVSMGLAYLSGNPVVNLKFCSSFFVKRFLHMNNFPYMVFSQKIKKEKELELNFSKILAAHPQYSNWKFEIDTEQGGKGTAVINVDSISILQDLRNMENEDERLTYVPQLTSYLLKYVSGYATSACQKLYYSFSTFREVLLARGGYIEAIPKGKLTTIGIACFISPSGRHKLMKAP
jgi:hypothetical protein